MGTDFAFGGVSRLSRGLATWLDMYLEMILIIVFTIAPLTPRPDLRMFMYYVRPCLAKMSLALAILEHVSDFLNHTRFSLSLDILIYFLYFWIDSIHFRSYFKYGVELDATPL